MSTSLLNSEPRTACPPPEELAAFIDGRLSGDDHARVLGHIGTCDDCHHTFVCTVEFLEEEERSANVVPFPARPVEQPASPGKGESDAAPSAPRVPRAPRRQWDWAIAASVATLVGLGAGWWWNAAQNPGASRLADRLLASAPADITQHLWQEDVTRSAGDPTDDEPHDEYQGPRLGAVLVDLEVSLARRDRAHARKTAETLRAEILDAGGLRLDAGERKSKTQEWFRDLPTLLAEPKTDSEPKTDFRLLLSELRTREAKLTQSFLAEEIRLGAWVEAARLAAATENHAFFQSWSNRRALQRLVDENRAPDAEENGAPDADEDRAPDYDVSADLEQVRELADHRDFKRLSILLDTIVARFWPGEPESTSPQD